MPTPKDYEKYPKSDWQYDVRNGDTKLGYEEWVEHQVESHKKTMVANVKSFTFTIPDDEEFTEDEIRKRALLALACKKFDGDEAIEIESVEDL